MTYFNPERRPPTTGVQRAAHVSSNGLYRWSLSRWWLGQGRVCWVMLNPSTADALADDPTIARVIHFTQSWGYGRADVVNVFPFRSSAPADCRDWARGALHGQEWDRRDALMANEVVIERHVRDADLVVVAWGAAAWAASYADKVLCDVILPNVRAVFSLGETAGGAPKHPLARGNRRIPDDQRPVLFRPELWAFVDEAAS